MFRPDIAIQDIQADIFTISAKFKTIKDKGTLGNALAHEVSRYSLLDLSLMGARYIQGLKYIPPSYYTKIKPYLTEQFFGAQHRLIQMSHTRQFDTMTEPISNPELYKGYWDMVPNGSFTPDRPIPHGEGKEALAHFYYYLLAAFIMFVMDEPGHPVGTPFPGGFTVHKKDQDYICYIRDKEKDVENSICNYCPAIAGE